MKKKIITACLVAALGMGTAHAEGLIYENNGPFPPCATAYGGPGQPDTPAQILQPDGYFAGYPREFVNIMTCRDTQSGQIVWSDVTSIYEVGG
jgi:hypothetical protein